MRVLRITILMAFKNVMLLDSGDLDNFINERIINLVHFSDNVQTYKNGEEALAFLKIQSAKNTDVNIPDIIFIELHLPGMNVYEFINEFKNIRNEALHQCRMVVLSPVIHFKDVSALKEMDKNILVYNKPLTQKILKEINLIHTKINKV